MIRNKNFNSYRGRAGKVSINLNKDLDFCKFGFACSSCLDYTEFKRWSPASIGVFLEFVCSHISYMDCFIHWLQNNAESGVESIGFPLRSQSGSGTSRPAALPRISSYFGFVILVFLLGTTSCHTEVWGTEKLTGKQTGRQTMYEQTMNIVRGKQRREEGGRRRQAFVLLLREEHTYPVRLNQKRRGRRGRVWGVLGRDGGRRWVKEGRMGRWKGRKDKMKTEERRPDQTEEIRAGIKGKKKWHFQVLDDVWLHLRDLFTSLSHLF